MENNFDDPIVIVSASRTPMGNFGGFFKNTPTPQLGKVAIAAALNKANLSSEYIDDVIMGCVLPAGLGQAPARQAALLANIPKSTGATTINKMCGSGMKAVMLAYDGLLANNAKMLVAGGMENMSCAPYLLEKARFGYRMGENRILDHMMTDGLEDAYDRRPMGYFAELCAEKYTINRKTMDEFAIRSLTLAKKANETGLFAHEIAPVTILEKNEKIIVQRDENVFTAKLEKIPLLKPAFKEGGMVTAANSSSISDGAAALIVTRKSYAEQLNLQPLAIIKAHTTIAQAPAWFTTAPIKAIQALAQKINWPLNSVDLFEINEAFAVVTLVAMQVLNLPLEKINIHGGACALGHPIGASGARIIVTLLHALMQNNLKRGIASLCIGGGEATALAVEII